MIYHLNLIPTHRKVHLQMMRQLNIILRNQNRLAAADSLLWAAGVAQPNVRTASPHSRSADRTRIWSKLPLSMSKQEIQQKRNEYETI